MSRESFRREIEDAFQRISGSPSPDLSAKVRSRLVDAPERRGPVWAAGVAAAVIAVLVLGAFFIAGPLSRFQHNSVPVGTHSPSPSPSPVASPTEPFVCGGDFATSTSSAPQSSLIDDIRVGTHTGYDRITFQFSNGQPADITVKLQNNASFTGGASGLPITLQGSKGLLVTFHVADAHTSYHGSTDYNNVGPGLREARQVEDFDGYVQWGLGLDGTGCYRVSTLTNPSRLVVDIQTP